MNVGSNMGVSLCGFQGKAVGKQPGSIFLPGFIV